jgi:hypothetical protein
MGLGGGVDASKSNPVRCSGILVDGNGMEEFALIQQA